MEQINRKTHVFMKNDYFCRVEQEENEPLEKFYERGNFIVSQKISSESDFNNANKFFKIWYNIKYLGCEYSREIMLELQKYENNL